MIFLPLSTVSYMQALTDVSLFQRDRLAQQLATRRGYLARLLELFRVRFLPLVLVGGCWMLWALAAAWHTLTVIVVRSSLTVTPVGRLFQMCEDLEGEELLHECRLVLSTRI